MLPSCFISYSWDNKDHKDWIRILATRLRENGVDSRLDQWDTFLGMDLPDYMESSIRNSDFVILVCTPLFAKKANILQGGVGYEKSVVTGEIFSGVSSKRKFIPILRSGSIEEALPSYLKSKLFVDFRDESQFNNSFQKLLRHIFNQPEMHIPPVGKPPQFVNSTLATKNMNNQGKTSLNLSAFKEAYNFAKSRNGLFMSGIDARNWALDQLSL